jgi:membrane associated rhomboid family serine protease
MGIADRDYHRTPQGGFLSNLTPVVKWLLVSNIAIFLLDYLLIPFVLDSNLDGENIPKLLDWGAFSIESAVHHFQVWRFISFQFLHGSLGHLLFNAMGIFFFGPWMERWWGSQRFLIFYLLCGIGGAAFFSLLTLTGIVPADSQSILVGASAGIYGIFIGVAITAPNLRVSLLFPPIELSMRQLAIALLAISAGSIILKLGGNEGGEAGHLGGAIIGAILMRRPQLLSGLHGSGTPRRKKSTERKIRPRTIIDLERDSEVDLILDKISREGFQSLTEREREVLRQAAQQGTKDS